MRSCGWGPHDKISALTSQEALPRNSICQCPGLGLPPVQAPPPPHLCRNNEAQCPRAHDGHTAEEPVTSLVPGGLEGKHHLLVTPRSEEEGLGPGRVLGKPCPGPAFLANRPPNCSSSNHRGSKAAICSKATDGSHEGCVVCIHCDGRPCWPRTFFGFQRRIFISWD